MWSYVDQLSLVLQYVVLRWPTQPLAPRGTLFSALPYVLLYATVRVDDQIRLMDSRYLLRLADVNQHNIGHYMQPTRPPTPRGTLINARVCVCVWMVRYVW